MVETTVMAAVLETISRLLKKGSPADLIGNTLKVPTISNGDEGLFHVNIHRYHAYIRFSLTGRSPRLGLRVFQQPVRADEIRSIVDTSVMAAAKGATTEEDLVKQITIKAAEAAMEEDVLKRVIEAITAAEVEVLTDEEVKRIVQDVIRAETTTGREVLQMIVESVRAAVTTGEGATRQVIRAEEAFKATPTPTPSPTPRPEGLIAKVVRVIDGDTDLPPIVVPQVMRHW